MAQGMCYDVKKTRLEGAAVKCPVCDNLNTSMLCPRCGFDASRDYEKYPTFGIVGDVPAISALQAERKGGSRITEQEKQQLLNRVAALEHQVESLAELCRHLSEKLDGLESADRKSAPVPMPAVLPEALPPSPVRNLSGSTDTAVPTPGRKRGILWEALSKKLFDTPVKASSAVQKRNILQEDMVLIQGKGYYTAEHATGYPVFGSKLRRNQIASLTFLDSTSHAPLHAWDVSADKNGSVLAWAVPNRALYDLYLAADGKIEAPKSCNDLFAGYSNMREIRFGNHFNTANVQTMCRMFRFCPSLKKLDLSGFQTASVQDMSWMFHYCTSLTELDLSSFDTSAVETMMGMFAFCSSLNRLDLSSFDISNVKYKSCMFTSCPAAAYWSHLER